MTIQKVGMIVGCDITGLIGYGDQLAYNNKTDLKRFKKLTMGSTVIVGRKTYDSLPIGKKSGQKLNGRIKHVLSRKERKYEKNNDTRYFSNLRDALLACQKDKSVWIIGGASVYKDALILELPDFIDLTIINCISVNRIEDNISLSIQKSSHLHPIPYTYIVESEVQNPDDNKLWHRRYIRRPSW